MPNTVTRLRSKIFRCEDYLADLVSFPASPGIPSAQPNYQGSDDTHKTLTASMCSAEIVLIHRWFTRKHDAG